METRTTILNFQPGTSIPVVHVSQYDVGVLLRFILYDGSEMAEIEGGSGTSVVIAATRPSGTGFSVPCSIIASNIVEVATTEAMTKEFGIMDAEIRYTNDGDSVGTGNFKFLVEAASHADYIIDEDHAEWVRIAQEVANDRASAQSAKQSAQQSATRAETAANRVAGEVDKAIAAAATATSAKDAAVTAKSAAETAAENAEASAINAGDAVDAAQLAADDAEAYAIGTRGGEPVTSTDPTYHNNSKYYAELGGAANLADAFSTSIAYAVDDYVLYNSKLWRFTTAHAAGAWNASHVAEVKAMDEVSDLKGDLSELETIVQRDFDCNDVTPSLSPGGYTGSVGSAIGENSDTNWRRCSVSVSEGELYKISFRTLNISGPITYIWLCNQNNIIQEIIQLTTINNTIIEKTIVIAENISRIYVRSYIKDVDIILTIEKISSSIDEIKRTVKFTAQSLTDNQKEQARENIGACSESAMMQLADSLNTEIATRQEEQSGSATEIANLNRYKVNQPLTNQGIPINGTYGQALRTNGDGTTSWASLGLPTNEQTNAAVSAWLEEHPEATTTVEDGSIGEVKLTEGLNERIDSASLPNILPIDVLYNKLNYDDYNICQGGCISGNYLYVCFTQEDNDTSVKLRRFSLSNLTVSNEVVVNAYHGQTVTSKDGHIYISNRQYIESYNANTLAFENTYTLDYSPLGMCINDSGNLVIIAYPDLNAREYSLPDFTFIRDYGILETELMHGVNQIDMEYANGLYYVLMSAPKSLYVYDETFSVVKRIDWNERFERISLMESEFIAYKGNDDFIIGWNTPLHDREMYSKANTPLIIQNSFTISNFSKGNTNNAEQNIVARYNPNRVANIYVNKNYSGYYSDGNWQYPYKEVQQAINNVNMENANLIIRIKPGTYAPVFAVDKFFMFDVWQNQTPADNLRDVIINSVRCYGGCGLIGEATLTENDDIGGYALRAESGARCGINVYQNNLYKVYVTTGGQVDNQGFNANVTMASGEYLHNAQTQYISNFKKNTGAAKILGRVRLYNGTDKNGTITLQNDQARRYALPIATLKLDSYEFTSILNVSRTTTLPFIYFSGTQAVQGTLTLTPDSSDYSKMTVAFVCYKGTTAYTPSNYNLQIEGVL